VSERGKFSARVPTKPGARYDFKTVSARSMTGIEKEIRAHIGNGSATKALFASNLSWSGRVPYVRPVEIIDKDGRGAYTYRDGHSSTTQRTPSGYRAPDYVLLAPDDAAEQMAAHEQACQQAIQAYRDWLLSLPRVTDQVLTHGSDQPGSE
jgi:hypothetical protein